MKNVTYINAGAGSGKTYRLTKTLTELIKAGKVRPEQVILTTFTTKAANEFKEKAKAFLYDEGLYDAAVQLDHAMIGTVHSVCQRMIGKYWFNLGLSPNMGVMAEEDNTYYISQSLADLPTEEELKVLHGFAREFDLREAEGYMTKFSIDYDFWQDHLKAVIGLATNYELDDFRQSEEESLRYIRNFVKSDSDCDFTYEELKAVLDEHEPFLRSQKQSGANDGRIEKLVQARRSLSRPTIGLLKSINSTIGTPKKYGPLAEEYQNRMAGLWTSSMVCRKQEAYIRLLFDLAQRWKENFAQFKREKNLLDYDDMEKYMRQLMQNKDIAAEISASYRYLFVDEFQDSSPIQVKIFDALSDLMEHSYWVGDYKQAIYGFRGSDIALTKAVVDRVATKENGCDTDTLDTSWRSLPDIVEVDNDVFAKTFSGVLSKGNICLKRHRENENHEDSLRYFVNSDECGVAEHVLKLLHQGAEPGEIAVLARANATLAEVASHLKEYDIPSSRAGFPIVETSSYALTSSLLRIVESTRDALAKATVAFLTEQDYNVKKIIEEKILNDADADAQTEGYLADVPLVRQLMTIRPKLQQQSVAALVESMIIELGLYDVVKKIESDPASGISCLQTIINTARVYEEHCVQMNLPATIDGFIAYIGSVSPSGSGDANGVQLHTYHSCKGLQWKYVILMSLNTCVSDVKKAVKNETYGVHPVHVEEPTAENPYPAVYIRLTPWVYGTARNVPDEISAVIEGSQGFKVAYQTMLSESNRVFYVGMTRPQDVLILSIDVPKRGAQLLQWPKDEGVDTAAESIPESGDWDVFGLGHIFKDFTLTQEEFENLQHYGKADMTLSMRLNVDEPEFKLREPRYISPSHIRQCGEIGETYDFGCRIPLGKEPEDMASVGDCIHQIFAGIEEKRPTSKIGWDEVICSYGLTAVLTDPEAIRTAWNNLYDKLTALHGNPVKTYHERPFRLDEDGRTIVGSIDLVWQTAEGDILVDFKTNPMGAKSVLNSANEHFAGWYAGQLDAYQDALEAAGEKVVKRYIYYPVSGLLVEVNRAVQAPSLEMFSNIFCFDARGIDLDKAIGTAINNVEDNVMYVEEKPDDEEIANHIYVVEGKSTQGIRLILLKTGIATVYVPYLASRSDVALAFGMLRAVKALDERVAVYDGDGETIADLSEHNEVEVYFYRLDNMVNLIENQGSHIGVSGFKNEFHVMPEYIKGSMPDADAKELTLKAYEDFAAIQWNYDDYSYMSRAEMTAPDGEQFVARLLTNHKGFAKVCQKVALCHGREVKLVDIDEFFAKTKDNHYVKRLDYAQFVIDEMPEKEWNQFYELFDAEPIRSPKTYILRWNPGISSFKMENYRDALERFPGGFKIDWSIYEWKQARKGDRYYMLRVGEGNTGIVFHGEFLSDPYEGGDWAGRGKKRHYVDINCMDAADPDKRPLATVEELQKAIPEIDWVKGHSGQLLTEEQAEKLDGLFG